MKAYIAGPMSSVGGNFNFPLFDRGAALIRAKGLEVFNPAEYAREHLGSLEQIKKLSKESLKRARWDLLQDEIIWIMQHAEIMFMLPGWERSSGATAERAVALAKGIPVIETGTMLLSGGDIKIDIDDIPEQADR